MKDFYSFFNSTGGELPNAQPLDDGEVNKYMKEFADRTETRKKVPFVYKSLIAASLAVLVAVGGTFGYSRLTHTQREPFVITVNAEEITPSGSEFSVGDQGLLQVTVDMNGNMEFKYAFELQCTGDDIESVTYMLDKDTIDLDDLHLYSKETEDEYGPLPDVEKTPAEDGDGYTSMTVDYGDQCEHGLPIVLIGNGYIIPNDQDFIQEYVYVYDNTIHCTVHYSDGTTSQQDIKLGFDYDNSDRKYKVIFTLIPNE